MQIGSAVPASWVTSLCRRVSEDRTLKALGVEVLGINVPRTAIVRTWNESLDVAFNEFGNTAGFFGGKWAIDRWLDKMIKQNKYALHPDPKILSQGRVIKFFGLVPPLVGFMVGMPYIRNALTAWRSGSLDFRNLITKEKNDVHDPKLQERRSKAIRKALKIGLSIFAIGAASAVAGIWLATTKNSLGMFSQGKLKSSLKPLEGAIKKICLPGAKGSSFDDWYAVLYWGLPTYFAWMAASRDVFEAKEWMLKTINFTVMYLGPRKLIDMALKKQTGQFIKQFPKLYADKSFSYAAWNNAYKAAPAALKPRLNQVIKFENTRLITDLGATAILQAIFPKFLNIYLTQKRMERAQALAQLRAQHPQRQPVLIIPTRRPQAPILLTPVGYQQMPATQHS